MWVRVGELYHLTPSSFSVCLCIENRSSQLRWIHYASVPNMLCPSVMLGCCSFCRDFFLFILTQSVPFILRFSSNTLTSQWGCPWLYLKQTPPPSLPHYSSALYLYSLSYLPASSYWNVRFMRTRTVSVFSMFRRDWAWRYCSVVFTDWIREF